MSQTRHPIDGAQLTTKATTSGKRHGERQNTSHGLSMRSEEKGGRQWSLLPLM